MLMMICECAVVDLYALLALQPFKCILLIIYFTLFYVLTLLFSGRCILHNKHCESIYLL